EAAQMLVRNISYEIPSLKKSINRSQQLHDEYVKKQEDFAKQANAFSKDYNDTAQKLGLRGESIIQEINDLLSNFPAFLQRLLVRLPELDNCRQHYLLFLEFLTRDKQEDINLPF